MRHVTLGDPWDQNLAQMVIDTDTDELCVLRQAVATLWSIYIGATRVENNQLESAREIDPSTDALPWHIPHPPGV